MWIPIINIFCVKQTTTKNKLLTGEVKCACMNFCDKLSSSEESVEINNTKITRNIWD